ncbi:MAG: response regulator transcription factor [Anaerolineae bacterium]|jgi:NarL family two-component system response regulator LiaR|nr:response regulator transcription factor [Anaerolineae bacterium]
MSKVVSKTDIKVLIAEDHPIMRQGLGVVLDAYEGVTLIGEAEDGEQVVRLAQQLKPDVIIMDLQMPVKDGIIAIQEISELQPDVHILVLTSYPDDDKVFQAIKAGAEGYFLKETRSEQLIEAIRMVHQGIAVLQPEIAWKLMAEIRQSASKTQYQEALTQRELEILKYLARGYSNQEIALQLVISTRTVATHVGNILGKLHLSNRTQVALYAIDQGLAAPPS